MPETGQPATGKSLKDQPHVGTAVVVLAAGEGRRMRSSIPKMLHCIGGRSMLAHVLSAARPLEPRQTAVVLGHGREQVLEALALDDHAGALTTVIQEEQLGTGHATRLALDALDDFDGTLLVLTVDAPLLRPETLQTLLDEHSRTGAAVTVLSAHAPDPTGYGRIIRDETGAVRRIVEQRDATETERTVTEINTAVMAFAAVPLRKALQRLSTDNAAGEEYLTDVIGYFVADGQRVGAVLADYDETAGVNDRVQLAAAGRRLRDRVVQEWMRSGVTFIDPAAAWIDVDVQLARDVVIQPGVQLLGSTSVGEGAQIGPDCTLRDTSVGAGAKVIRTTAESASIGPDCSVGPYAYLRPGARLEHGAKVGTYVEVKKASIGPGSKVPHLTYVGDATIGADVNIGASSVFVNYDGVSKRHSVVEDGARTGADNTFVAPVRIGAGAYTGAGAVIREDVPPGALAVSAGSQRIIEGWTERKRAGTPAAEAAAKAGDTAQAEDSGKTDNHTDIGYSDRETGVES